MNKLQQALLIAGALSLVHVAGCLYILATTKRGNSRKRSLILIAGNLVLLLLFYVPTQVVPKGYVWMFAVGFVGGFAGLVQYVKWLSAQDDTGST